MRVKFVEIRPFANKAVISSESKNSGFENSFKNRLFYLQRIHDVMAVISRQQYAIRIHAGETSQENFCQFNFQMVFRGEL